MKKILVLISLVVMFLFVVSCAPSDEAVAGQALRISTSGSADLTVESLQLAFVKNVSTGNKDLQYTVVVKNVGTALYNNRAKALTYFKLLPNMTELILVPFLDVGASATSVGKFSYYPWMQGQLCKTLGQVTVYVKADITNIVPETNENNNVKQLDLLCGADLVVNSINYTLLPNPTTGKKDVELSVTFKNLGKSWSAFATDYDILAVGTINHLQVKDAVLPLAPGAVSSVVKYTYTPNTCPHALTLTADYLDSTVELNDGNNAKQVQVTC